MENKELATELYESLDGFRKKMPSEEFLLKMEEVTVHEWEKNQASPFQWKSIIGIAASLIFVVFINGYALIQYNESSVASNTISENDSYDLIPVQILYDE
ncbi:MAG: hypothetical protein P1U56_10025 [Saprospiraceae bacterium]|nr:hypothetical protein [Saprospiraceae bacterium]